MKYTILIIALYTSAALCRVASVDPKGIASKGAVIEGLFIIQNKHRDAKDEIQELKKELTACFAPKEKLSILETYHCKLRKLLYPSYIDELSRVIKYADKEVPLLKKDTVEQKVLDKAVQQAFLLIEKIELERKLLEKTFEVDRKLKQISTLKKKQDPRQKEQVKISEVTSLQDAIKKTKQEVAALKKRIQEINGTLFNGTLTQEVFLDKLAYYIP